MAAFCLPDEVAPPSKIKAMVTESTWKKVGAFVRRVPILSKSGPKPLDYSRATEFCNRWNRLMLLADVPNSSKLQ